MGKPNWREKSNFLSSTKLVLGVDLIFMLLNMLARAVALRDRFS